MDKLFVFSLGFREMAADALKVHEVLMVPKLTTMADSPAFIAGVANLRGNIIPVVDTHKKLGVDPSHKGTDRLVVFKIAGAYLGFVVDAVKLQLIEGVIEGSTRKAKPKGNGKLESVDSTVSAELMAHIGDQRIPVFDPETLLTTEELESIATIRKAF